MDDCRSELTKALVRQGLRMGSAGTDATREMKGASSQVTALSAMGWANALLDREEGEIDADHSPAGGRELRRIGIQEAGTEAPALLPVGGNKEPSPGRHTRPVLKLLDGGNRQRPTRYVVGPCLVLIKGGKC